MIKPVFAYGQPVLKKVAHPIDEKFPNLEKIIETMWDTMYNAKGVGLAAPQIGQSIRVFIIDSVQIEDEKSNHKGIKRVFINAQKIEEKGEEWTYEEGCLSIPNIRADVDRPKLLKIKYQDEHFNIHTEEFDGLNARVIQHEYDHIEGILFTDHIKPLKRRLINRKLDQIRKGKVNADYPLKFKKLK